jgi:hypothetical protein
VTHFAGHDEPTKLEPDGTLSTGVKPQLWTTPVVVKVSVHNGQLVSNEVDFEFDAPAVARETKGTKADEYEYDDSDEDEEDEDDAPHKPKAKSKAKVKKHK